MPRILLCSLHKKFYEFINSLLFCKTELIITDNPLQMQDCLVHDTRIATVLIDFSGIDKIEPLLEIVQQITQQFPQLKIIGITDPKQKAQLNHLPLTFLIKPFNEEKLLEILNLL